MPIDYNQYHPKWSLIRRLILKRANNKCERCGVNNYEILPSPVNVVFNKPLFDDLMPGQMPFYKRIFLLIYKWIVILSVAHLDHNRNNNRFSNLAALCQRCHLRHDLFQRVFSFKYGKETRYVNGKLFHE